MYQEGSQAPGETVTCATTAERILSVLGQQGVEYIFLNPGTDTAPFQEAAASLAEKGARLPRVVPCPHESAALAAAEGYWQATGRPQCVMVHVDVGTQNLGAMLHDAQRGHTGVVIIAGKAPYDVDGDVPGGRSSYIHWRQDEPDQIGIVRGYTKWAQEITRPGIAERAVSRAIQVARSAPAGPAYLMVSRDVLMEPPPDATVHCVPYAVPAAPAVAPAALLRMAQALAEAQRPVLITSCLGCNPAAVGVLTELAELLGMQVLGRPESLNIRWSHPLYLRTEASASQALASADTILIVDCDVPWIPKDARPRSDAFIIQIDADPVKADMPFWSFPVNLSAMADSSIALEQLVASLEEKAAGSPALRTAWAGRRKSLETAAGADRARSTAPGGPGHGQPGVITMTDLVGALNEVISTGDIVMEEAVTNAAPIHAGLVREEPASYFAAGGPGLGWALGASVGMKLARPDRNVIALVGDGSFLFGVPSASLTLAAEARAPFMAVILDNGRYRASERPVLELFPQGTSARSGAITGTHFSLPPDFAKLAAACHAYGERVTEPGELTGALSRARKALDEGRCAVVDVVLPQAPGDA